MYFVHVHRKGLMRTYILDSLVGDHVDAHFMFWIWMRYLMCFEDLTENDRSNISYPEDSSDED